MAANLTDKFKKVGTSTVTTLAAPGKAMGANSITVGSTTNYPTDTAIIIAIRKVDTNGSLVAGTYTEWIATVTNGTTLALNTTPVYGNDQVYSAGSTTQVYIPTSAKANNDMIDGILLEHNQDGTHKTVPVAKGGTGATTAQGAVDNVLGATSGWITAPALTWVSTDGPTQVLKAAGVDVRSQFPAGTRIKYQQAQAISNYWSFDTNSADSKGSAVMADIGVPTYTAGKFSNALTLNGTNQALSITDNAAFKPTDNFTIGCWFKTSSAGSFKAIFTSKSRNTNDAGLVMQITSGNNLQFAIGNNSAAAGFESINGTTTVTDGNFHYGVFSFRNNFGQLYVDGKLEASGYMRTPAYAATNYVRIGCQNFTGANQDWFNGQIDDLFIINGYALDEATIAAKYTASTAQGTADLTLNKCAVVSADATLSASDTMITTFGGTDYMTVNAAITNPFYSGMKAPYGFPLRQEKWKVEISDSLSGNGLGIATAGSWYNYPGLNLVVPIGEWEINYKTMAYANGTAGTRSVLTSLGLTSTSTDVDLQAGTYVNSAAGVMSTHIGKKEIKTYSKTTYYFNVSTTITGTAIYLYNDPAYGGNGRVWVTSTLL
ncbi:MAG: LamG domain-containing protein [Bacteroidota bacterium]|nr:LamG domain-containing protein [Bacteroidota bacterium]